MLSCLPSLHPSPTDGEEVFGFLQYHQELINLLVIVLTFRHAGLDPASRNSLDSGACHGARSGVYRNDVMIDNYEMVNKRTFYS
jgi:hypothetical protein